MKKKQLILFCYHHGGDKTRFMTHLRPHTSCAGHFSHAPKIGTGKQSACQCVHQVLQEEIGSFGLFALQSAIFFIAVLFLMVSINICRVISTFITQGAFPHDVVCFALVVFFWTGRLLYVVTTIQRAASLSPCWWTVMWWSDTSLVESDWQKCAVIGNQISFIRPISHVRLRRVDRKTVFTVGIWRI